MLQAVLEEEEDSPNDKADAEEINGLDGEDRRSIQKRKCRYNVFRGIHS
jgi:serine/threonine-protein kinase ULK/ATG1